MRWAIVVPLIVFALAGCLDSSGTGADGPQPVAKVPVHGQVMTPSLVPVAGAIVVLQNPGQMLDDGTVTKDLHLMETTTDGDGMFSFQSFPGKHGITVEGFGIETVRSNVTVPGPNVTLFANPVAPDGPTPFHQQFPFDGYIECGFEALIITPSCDSGVTFAGGPAVFTDDSAFTIQLEDNWETIVLDVYFDGSTHPGVAGLRASAYQPDDSVAVLDYPRITQDWSPQSFTLRITPGTDYGDAVPSPEGAGAMMFRFFTHGHGSEQTEPFLGVGAAQAFTFDSIATVFYHAPAPEGWTLLES